MTQILRGLGSVVSNIGQGLNQAALGVAAAAPSWPDFELKKRQLADQVQIEQARIKQAEEKARFDAMKEGNDVAFKRTEINLFPLKRDLDINGQMLTKAVEEGNAQLVEGLQRQRQEIFRRMQAHLSGTPQSDLQAATDYGPQAPQPEAPMVPGIAGVEAAGSSGSAFGEDFPLALDSKRDKNLADLVYKYRTIAENNPDIAVDQIEDEMGGLSEDERTKVRNRLIGVGGEAEGRRQFIDPTLGIAIDPVTLQVTQIPNLPRFGEMTKGQMEAANEVFQMWKTASSLPKMYATASLTHGAAKAGYERSGSVGHIALLYSMAKMVAPDDSAVREGEFETMAEAMGWMREKLLLPKKFLAGDKLDPEGERAVWVIIDEIWRSRQRELMAYSNDFAELATMRGLKPDWAIPGWSKMEPGGLMMQSTQQLIPRASESPEIQAELRRRLGVREGESLRPYIDWWLAGHIELRASTAEAMRRGAAIQRSAEQQMRSLGVM